MTSNASDQLRAPGNPDPAVDGTVTGAPLPVLGDLLSGPRVDDLLRRAAVESPDRLALDDGEHRLSFAELDARVDTCAAALRRLTGWDDASGAPRPVIAVTNDLDSTYATLFFGIARAGMTSALVSPLLRSEQLIHVLRTSGATTAFASQAAYEQLAGVRDRLPELHHLLSTRQLPIIDAPTSLERLIAAEERPSAPVTCTAGSADIACLQYTNGTTGALKAVRLSHGNITVNAAQTAYACGLNDESVLLNNLPTFHLMHLVAATTARAGHVLTPTADPTEAIGEAARCRATHFYSLPVRLITLAADAGLSKLEAPSLQVIMSGGSTMPPHATIALSQHFGVPVIQGYGLAEASPIVCCDTPARPRQRSTGRPVAGTAVRTVDTSTREVLPRGARGEIQVAGPQLMQGYLGRDRGQDIDDEGWFTTGDVGYLDDDGYLFIVDRIKDVFKCDNWLVSPTEIERVLLRAPGVADAVVIDYPHESSGSVAYAVVVPRSTSVQAEAIQDFVAARLPYYDHLRYVEFVDAIPRSANGGKVVRRAVRDRVHAAAGPRPRS